MAGHTQVGLVSGEPGIGKSRLLQEVALRAEETGARVLRGGASEAEGMPPYLPFLEALGTHIRATPPEQLQNQVGSMAPVLVTILPELAVILGKLSDNYPLPADQARLRLYEAVGMFLAALARSAPLVLLLDDLQWADPASLGLLQHVVRQQSTARLLILGAYQAGELASNPALERLLLDLNRTRLLTPLAMGPLGEEEIAALAASHLGLPIEPKLSRFLHQHSEGNPFFAEELLRSWLETGELQNSAGHFTLVRKHPAALPSSIIGTMRERLARLPRATVEYLRTAALIGRTFEIPLLAQVLGQDAESVEEALLVAIQAGLLRQDAPGIFTFNHNKVRECLSAEVTSMRRRRLHGFIGHVLEMQADQDSAQHLADLAFHFTQSGDRTRGVHYARLAAEQAWQASAPEEALKHYRVVIELLPAKDLERGALLLRLGEAAIWAGAEREAIATFEEAQQWFQEQQNMPAAARAAHGLGRAWGRLEAHSSAQAALETALARLENSPDPERVHILVDLAVLLAVSLGKLREGIAYGEQALDLARCLENERLEAVASRTVGNLLMRENHLAEALVLLERALNLARAFNDPVEASECCACLTLAYAWSGRLKSAQDITRARLEWARLTHDPYQERHVYTWLALFPVVQGKFAEAEQWLAQAETALVPLVSPEPRAFLAHSRGWLAYHRGDYAVAEAHFSQAAELFRGLGPGVLVWYLAPLGMAQLRQGRRDDAIACMIEVETLLASQQEGTMVIADAMSKLALMALWLDDHERVAAYYPQLLPFQGQGMEFLLDRVLGEMETLLGFWSEAQAHLSAAEEIARREGFALELAWTLVAQGRLALTRGGQGSVTRTRALFEQARLLLAQLNLQEDAQALNEYLERLPGKSPVRKAHPLPAGLSAREVEVLRLTVSGKSNRQIADELMLSERTVANHLAHIFNKTGTDNRAAATAFAIRHGLA